MVKKLLARTVVALLATALIGVLASTPVYGATGWQVAFAATGNDPRNGDSFGFMGSCTFTGGVGAGNAGRCDIAQHLHGPAGSGFTCSEGFDITAWDTSVSSIPPTMGINTFHITGTATVQPASLTQQCVAVFPGSTSFVEADMQLPALPGHHNLGGLGATVGEFQVTVRLL